ncbi:MAG: hypothetical protein WC375_09440 [Methanomassiliicoccales archaeon]|jgi:hypothetical protein
MVEFISDVNTAGNFSSEIIIPSTSQDNGTTPSLSPLMDVKITPKDPPKLHKEENPTLSWKEIHALKKSKYYKVSQEFSDVFVLKNKKSGMVVEMKAATSFHAASMIGWKPKQVIVLEHRVANNASQVSEAEIIPPTEIIANA